VSASLALHRSLLFVGTAAKTARVQVFDLDGHARMEGFRFRDARAGRSTASGIAVDEDRRIWVSDTPASRLRRFLIVGREDGGLGLELGAPLEFEPWLDARGVVRAPLAVAVTGNGEEGTLAVGMHGDRRHAVQVFDVESGYSYSPAPMGRGQGIFRGVRGVELCGRLLLIAECYGQRIQVFRDGSFHFGFGVDCAGQRFEPSAVRALEDGRLLVSTTGAASSLLLVDSSGKLLRVLAHAGADEGCVQDPTDLVLEPGQDDAHTRVAVIDRDGLRVQVFTLLGRCFGSFCTAS